MPAFSIYSY